MLHTDRYKVESVVIYLPVIMANSSFDSYTAKLLAMKWRHQELSWAALCNCDVNRSPREKMGYSLMVM